MTTHQHSEHLSSVFGAAFGPGLDEHPYVKTIRLPYNPETGTTSEGESIDEALANLKEATSLHLEEFPTGVSGHPLVTMFSVPAYA